MTSLTNSTNSTNSEYFSNLEQILYFPDIDYIPYESIYNKLNTDWIMSNNNIKNSLIDIIDVRNEIRIWNIFVDRRYINKEFFKIVHNMNIDNLVLPPNSVCAIYYNKNETENKTIKEYFWSSKENELLYNQFTN
jgi:hypothetical protein